MSRLFEEIDTQDTAIGEISLRRRQISAFGPKDIYEVKLGDEYLMSSMFVEAEIALADLALKETDGETLRVVVGGLGLGYTAQAALRDPRIEELLVVEALHPVIQWHEEGKVPLGHDISNDPRCRFVHADFFAAATSDGFDPTQRHRLFDAVLLDIDHSPRTLLHDNSSFFYRPENLRRFSNQLVENGVFAMWSNEPSDQSFMDDLQAVFDTVKSEVVSFYNPLQDTDATNTVYIAKGLRRIRSS